MTKWKWFLVIWGCIAATCETWYGIAERSKEGSKVLESVEYPIEKPLKSLYIWYDPVYIDSLYLSQEERVRLFRSTTLDVEEWIIFYFYPSDVLAYSFGELIFQYKKTDTNKVYEIWNNIAKKTEGILRIKHQIYIEERKAFIERLFGLERKAINRLEIELFSFQVRDIIWRRVFEVYLEDTPDWDPETLIMDLSDTILELLQEKGYINKSIEEEDPFYATEMRKASGLYKRRGLLKGKQE